MLRRGRMISSSHLDKMLETKIVMQCSPVFCGVKIANTLIVESKEKERVLEFFIQQVLSCYLLYQCEQRVVFLICHKSSLQQYLDGTQQRNFMEKIGYLDSSIEEIIHQLAQRFETYRKDKCEFPHELGVLLGYPIKDIEGFMVNKGNNYLYAGYWKVYDDVMQAREIFERYDQAKREVLEWIIKGNTLVEMMTLSWEGQKSHEIASFI